VHKLYYSLILFILIESTLAFAISDPTNIDQKAGITEHLGEVIDPNIEFIDEESQSVSIGKLLSSGLPLVIAPVYFECPRLCNFTQAGLLKTINKIRSVPNKDYIVLSISFNSKEKAELAKNRSDKYREQIENKTDEEKKGWKFLVGNDENIQRLLNQIGFKYEFDQGEFMHSAGLIFVSPKGKIVRYLYGIEFPSRDFDLAVSEASEGRVGESLLNKAIIFCFRYDHLKGQYTFAIWRLIQVVSIAFVIVLFLTLIGFKLKEKTSSK
jgi:protein SCO1/2